MNIERIRGETPGCINVIHFNNAGASLMPKAVIETVQNHLNLECEIGGYEAERKEKEKLQNVYSSIAKFINSSNEEIALVENATRAWDLAFYSIPFQPGDVILTSEVEYASNYIAFLQLRKRMGVEVNVIPNDEYGRVSVEALQNLITPRTKLIEITHIPTNGGLINPVEEIGKIANENNILYMVDACQSVGQIPVNVKKIGCDFLSATSRKYLRGPRGMGFLYVKKNICEKIEPIILDLHSATWVSQNEYSIRKDAKRFETWESYVAGKLGLGTAVDYALSLRIDNIWERVNILGSKLREQLASIPGVNLFDLGKEKCGIVSLNVSGKNTDEVFQNLSIEKINVSVSPKEYTFIDMNKRKIESLIRTSVHYYNTELEIDMFCNAIESIAVKR